MAFAAVQGQGLLWTQAWDAVPPMAWTLLFSNLFWVLAYDTEYAMVDRDDDLRIGMKTSAITLGRYDVRAIMAFYALHLVLWWVLMQPLDLGWPVDLAGCLAAAQALWHHHLIKNRQRETCFLAFRMNHWLGATLFAGIALGFARH
jgi:4-hydroxybenzoate polyprenyltransferase